jgi:hypothetical protein
MPEFTLAEAIMSLLIALELSEKLKFRKNLIGCYFLGEALLIAIGILFFLSGLWLGLTRAEQAMPRALFLSFTYVCVIRIWEKFRLRRR